MRGRRAALCQEGNGRLPIRPERMLRIHLRQHCQDMERFLLEAVSKSPKVYVNFWTILNLAGRDNRDKGMGKPIVDDESWALIEALLPPRKPRRFRYPGRMPIADRAALTGILFVLRSGIRWSELPGEMGCGPA